MSQFDTCARYYPTSTFAFWYCVDDVPGEWVRSCPSVDDSPSRTVDPFVLARVGLVNGVVHSIVESIGRYRNCQTIGIHV